MPESFGKRQRREVKAKKAVAREQRRVARNERRHERAAGLAGGQPLDDAIPEAEQESIVDELPDGRDGVTELDET